MRRNRLHRDVLPVYNRPSVTVCWSLELLGGAWLRGEGERVALERKAAGLLAYLALEGPTPRGKLAGLLWPDAGDKRARNNLRQLLYKLRPYAGLLVGDDPLCLRDVCVVALDLQHYLDTADLERLAARFPAPPDLLAGLEYDDCPDFDEWLSVERERFKTRWLGALSSHADALEGEGDYRAALPLAHALLIESPLSEVAYRRLMRLHSLLGDRAAALEVYARCREALGRELGVAPLPETCELARAIEEGAPPSRSALLPRYPTPFIGRARELAEIEALLLEPSCRLLVLTGPGGSGKTRLAVEAAAKVDANRDGHYFVPLSALNDSSLLVSAIASAIGFSFYSTTDPDTQLLEHLREKELLLVLDNFEHLREGAGFLLKVLEGAPNVKLLLTSRERLGLPGEWVRELDGLPLPDSADIVEESEAVQLFLTNARRSAPRLTLAKDERVALMRICRLTGGLPLALELASAWVWALSLEEIAAGLEESLAFLVSDTGGLPERHRSLRASFDHSWRLLPDGERQALARLAIFRGGFTAEAAAAVADAPLATLLSLMGRSLVGRDASGRFGMHELLRQYAKEKLAGEAEVQRRARDRHQAYYLRFVAEAKARMYSEHQQEALQAIEGELANVRTALARTPASDALEPLREALSPLWSYFDNRGRYREGIETFALVERSLNPDDPRHAVALGRMRIAQAWLHLRVGHYAQAAARAQAGLELLPADREGKAIAVGTSILGNAEWRSGNYQEAKRHFETLVETVEVQEDHGALAAYLANLGLIEQSLGNYRQANEHLETALRLCRVTAHPAGEASALCNLGDLKRLTGKFDEAQARLEEGLRLAHKTGLRDVIPHLLNNLARLERDRGELEQAETHALEARKLAEASGDRTAQASALANLGQVAIGEGDPARAKALFQEALAIAWSVKDLPLVFAFLLEIAKLTLAAGKNEHAACLLRLVASHPASERAERDAARSLFDELNLSPGKSAELHVIVSEALGRASPEPDSAVRSQ
jgi:predicted ATPase/DNA-binding SARP family transcriptional activator